jgi:predicted transcriptional regulator
LAERPPARERVRQLLDELPESKLPAAERFLAFLNGRRQDEEELTKEEWAALQEGREDLAAGRVVSQEEMRREIDW